MHRKKGLKRPGLQPERDSMRLPTDSGSLRAGRCGQDRALAGGALHKSSDNTDHGEKPEKVPVAFLSGMPDKPLKWQKPNRHSKE